MSTLIEIPLERSDFDGFRKLIYSLAGISLSEGKHVLVQSRLARRLRVHNLNSYSDYHALLRDPTTGDQEREYFINCLTTNKTEFFREKHHFEYLTTTILPHIREQAAQGGPRRVRIWSAACSSGQEPYTLAMTLRNFFGPDPQWDLKILASDIDTEMLYQASQAIYSRECMEDVPAEQKKRHFSPVRGSNEEAWKVHDALRDMVVFRRINLNDSPWPIHTCFDVIFCRNAMIYFDKPTQQRVIDRFAQKLNPRGYFVVGHSESLFGLSDQFTSVGSTIYRLSPTLEHTADSADGKSRVATTVPKRTVAHSRKTPDLPPTLRDDDCVTPSGEMPQGPSVSIIVGEYFASGDNVSIRTTLGSCVAVCLLDLERGIGGMNHFMLPQSSLEDVHCASYGVHSMEMLVNALQKLGSDRRCLQAKMFGGASVIGGDSAIWKIGEANIEFARRFLAKEGIPVVAQHVGGQQGMQVQMFPRTGKVLVRMLDSRVTRDVALDQVQAAKQQFECLVAQTADRTTLFSDTRS